MQPLLPPSVSPSAECAYGAPPRIQAGGPRLPRSRGPLRSRVDDWWRRLSGGDESFFDAETKAWLASMGMHVLILVALSLLAAAPPKLQRRLTIFLPIEQESEEPLQILDMTFDVEASDETLPEVGVVKLGVAPEAAPVPQGATMAVPDPQALLQPELEVAGANLNLEELTSNDSAGLVEDLAGIEGAVVNAHSDLGAVDRITTEILARLELSDVLVVWLMDASESLRPRRQQIIDHFTRVYDELDAIAGPEDQRLLTAVAAFGQQRVMMTSEPTSDRAQIQAVVGDIEADPSGVENVFAAVKSTALDYAKFAHRGRKVMMIVVTDEAGDDPQLLEEAIDLLQRHQMVVYVMGPAAPFAREELTVKWVDEATRQTYYLPVDCGPESAFIEQARLAVWKEGPGAEPLESGFGPFALTRIARSGGGLYLMHRDERIAGPRFSAEQLAGYRPDYAAAAEFQKRVVDNRLRLAVLRTAHAANQRLGEALPREFLAAGIQFEIKAARKRLADTVDVLGRGLHELKQVEAARGKEASARWRAHHDLLKGRLLANKVRCYSYAQLLDDMYEHPRLPEDGTKNAWQVASQAGAETDAEAGAAAGAEEAPAGLPPELQRETELARDYLQRVIDEHPDTPWAALAADELKFALAFHWQETFIDPPEGVPLPWDKKPWEALTDAEKQAKVAYDKKKAARAKRKKDLEDEGVAKRSPPKL